MQNRFLGAVLVLVAGAIAAPAQKPVVCEVKVSIRGKWVSEIPDTVGFVIMANDSLHRFFARLPFDTTVAIDPWKHVSFGIGFREGYIESAMVRVDGSRGSRIGVCQTATSSCAEAAAGFLLRPDCSID